VSRASWLVNVREHLLNVIFELHIIEGESIDATFDVMLFFLLYNILHLLPQRKFMGDFIFSWRGILVTSSA
jgi:hypothetical protein